MISLHLCVNKAEAPEDNYLYFLFYLLIYVQCITVNYYVYLSQKYISNRWFIQKGGGRELGLGFDAQRLVEENSSDIKDAFRCPCEFPIQLVWHCNTHLLFLNIS